MPSKNRPILIGSLLVCVSTLAPAADLDEGRKQARGESQPTILESITITATRGEHSLDEVPGTVSVIEAERIDALVMSDIRDLVRYEPGVYVENSSGRLGLGGFNIRGIGGNRVLTRIDGVPTAEAFEFGHFDVTPFTLDLDSVARVEILRGAASSLYGSDALGGVVSFDTKDPRDYLASGSRTYLGVKTSWDGRDRQAGTTATGVLGGDRWQGMVSVNYSTGHERDNQGSVDAGGATRTTPNPQDGMSLGFSGKLVLDASDRDRFELSLETFDRETETDVRSALGFTNLGAIFGFPPSVTYLVDKQSSEALDEQRRRRLSLESSRTGSRVDNLLWRLHAQASETEQRTTELRSTTLGGGPFGPLLTTDVLRTGLMTFEQETFGVELQAQEAIQLAGPQLLTFGGTLTVDRFDQLRDRRERDFATGAALPSSDGLTYPTKYFPRSRVFEAGLFGQAELTLAGGRLTLIPGLRYDRFELAVDGDDEIFLSGNLGTPPPVEMSENALSPKLGMIAALGGRLTMHAQYAHGFRAPPYSAVNSGFTHLAGGLIRLPNPDLQPEESDGFELGLRGSYDRGSFSLTVYENRYEDFIELVVLGFNPTTGLTEFQQRNVASARIGGIEVAADARLNERWYLRSSFAWSEGEDRTRSLPLNSIHPAQMAVGLRRSAASDRWRVELASRLVDGKGRAELDDTSFDQFVAPGYEVFDLYAGWNVSDVLTIEAGVLNLSDEIYWEWTDALGQREGSSILDRFTAPGRSASIALRYRR